MLKKILVILAVLLVFANECFALEGRKIANVGAEMLYTRILQTCVNNGISQNSFSELYKGNGEFYTYFFYPQNDNVIQTTLDYNNDGYVTLISIDGAGLDEQQRLTVYGMAVACLKALNITETEMQYLFDNLQENKSKYKINNDKLYTSRVFSVVNRTTITLMVSIYPSVKILVYISNIGE